MTYRHQLTKRSRNPRHSRSHHGHPILRGIGVVVVAALAFGTSAAAAVTYQMRANISVQEWRPQVAGTEDPGISDPSDGAAVNILLLGSDDRSGENAAIGGKEGGQRSDTTLILHISADRSRVELISIPRDSIVDIPSCTMPDGSTTKPRPAAMFNEAFAVGWDHGQTFGAAAGCTAQTIQVNTGLVMDHYIVVDFAGFQDMVEAIHGVEVCVEEPMRDYDGLTNLDLDPGLHTLNGAEALDFARARHVTGTDGSDLQRIPHQQQLLAAIAHQVLATNVLTNATDLLDFASAVTKSLTMDPGLSLATIAGLAYGAREINRNNIVFLTIPVGPYPKNNQRVVWTSQAEDVWDAVDNDTPVIDVFTTDSAPAQTSAPPSSVTPSGAPSVAPTTTPELPKGMTTVGQVEQDATDFCGTPP